MISIGARRFFSTTTKDLVQYQVNDRIGTLMLNDPDRLNCMTEAMGQALEDRVQEIICHADKVDCVLLRGAGRAFSAGGDLAFLHRRARDSPSRNTAMMSQFYARFLSLRKIPVPTISVIHGPAIGAGLCITLFTDMRILAEQAKVGFTFVKLGLHPGMACTHFLPSMVGHAVASRWLSTGEMIDPHRALAHGLVNEVVPKEDVVSVAEALASDISAQASPLATRSLVETLRAKQDRDLPAALAREAEAQAMCYQSSDFLEGLEAVAEKRVPVFTNVEHYRDDV